MIAMSDLSVATKIRLSPPPTACASCWGQYTDRQHVDFGASYDGPVVDGESGIANHTTVAIDDLIICDECLSAAAALLGLTRDEDQAARTAELEAEVDDLRQRLLGAMDYIEKQDAEKASRGSLLEALRGPEPEPEKKPAPRGKKAVA